MSDVSRDPIIGEWRGERVYGCPFCPFDTHSLDAIADHLRGVHHEPEGADPVEEAAEPVAEAVAESAPETVEEQAPETAPEAPPVEETPAAEPEPESTPAPDVPVAPEPASTDDDE